MVKVAVIGCICVWEAGDPSGTNPTRRYECEIHLFIMLKADAGVKVMYCL